LTAHPFAEFVAALRNTNQQAFCRVTDFPFVGLKYKKRFGMKSWVFANHAQTFTGTNN
jgi:hypothetical protein